MKTIILNVAFLVFGLSLFAQNTWTVDNRPGTTAQFTSVQAAHNAAAVGDFIYVHPSPNPYDALSIKKRIHVRGIGHGAELTNGERAIIQSIALSLNTIEATSCSGSSISGLAVETITDNGEGVFTDVVIQNNTISYLNLGSDYNFIIQGNVFNSASGLSITFRTTSHGNTIISNNFFNPITNANIIIGLVGSDIVSNNLFLMSTNSADNKFFSGCNNPTVSNNIFLLSTAATATSISTINSTINYQNCLTFAYGGQTLEPLIGSGNLNNTNPQFENIGNPENPSFAYTKSYKLKVGSLAIGSGSDGTDLGLYGQNIKFQMKGYPFDLPYPTTITINNPTVQAGNNLQVVLKASANVEN